MLGVSVRKIKGLTEDGDSVTVSGKGRQNLTRFVDMYMSQADLHGINLPLALLTKTRDVIASATDMRIVYHVTLVEASRNVNLGTRYDS